MVSVSCNGKFVPAVGISSSAMADFAQVTPKVTYLMYIFMYILFAGRWHLFYRYCIYLLLFVDQTSKSNQLQGQS